MTFYEAALHVLGDARVPLDVDTITRRAIDQGLLSHVGRDPEAVMRARLVAMAKRPADRKLLISAKDTFALVDWMIPEDLEAALLTAAEEPPDAEAELPYRSSERHPEPSAEYVRSVGRQSDRRRPPREGDDQRRRTSVADAAIEVLSESATPVPEATLLEKVRERDLPGLEQRRLRESLTSDNQQRLSSGRQPRFAVTAEGELRLTDEGDTSGTAVQQALVRHFGLSQPTRPPEEPQPVEPAIGDEAIHRLKDLLKDARRASAEAMRARLAGLDAAVFERACVKLLHSLRFREIKGARRNREGRALTAKLRDGSLEIRYVIRVTVATVDRRLVQEVRRELDGFGAQLGLILSPVHARGDARSDALGGGKLVALWCGNGLGEKFLDAKVGVTSTSYELFDLDPAFFEKAQADAAELAQRRHDRAQGEDTQAKVEATPPAAPGETPERSGRRRRRRRRGGQRAEGTETGSVAAADASTQSPSPAASEGQAASETQTASETKTASETQTACETQTAFESQASSASEPGTPASSATPPQEQFSTEGPPLETAATEPRTDDPP